MVRWARQRQTASPGWYVLVGLSHLHYYVGDGKGWACAQDMPEASPSLYGDIPYNKDNPIHRKKAKCPTCYRWNRVEVAVANLLD